ncbi:NAD(P)/FAD-dependent oxidoreductase [Phycicoccus flavus]|uniref:NAD(P)/FAD-dependent oxidoreductase n=1 Tax=Phycicoccus flavus TaxID=2502783 RepID=UPI000FEB8619|nr:FAD-dependent oxidoreductase [Phycicoccus flavus]NHA69189.1 oxidoreductase [Phycicoccus flavus]
MDPHPTDPSGLLVLGSGPAGVHAAAAYLAAGGPGPVRLVTADRDEPYQRPPLSKAVLAGTEPARVTPILEGEDAEALAGVEVLAGSTVVGLDRDRRVVRTDDGRELAYDRLVVATGADPARLPGCDPDARVFALRSLEHARDLADAAARASSAVVVGSGFIGCEAAASLAARGVRTTLVTTEAAPQEARLGAAAAGRIAGWLREDGVDVRASTGVESVRAPAEVHLEDGDVVPADLVVTAVGVTRARDFLEESRLPLEDGRVVVDARMRTEDPHVHAAGDGARARHEVAGRHLSVEHWGDAVAMGRVAGRDAASPGAEPWSTPPGFWSDIGGRVLKHSAWGDGWSRDVLVEHPDGAFTVWYADADGELVGVLTHERDEDYGRGGELLARRARIEEALAGS